MILIDSNVLVIDLRYRRDPLFPVNRKFLDRVKADGNGATTLVNLLEVAGILSHNLNPGQLQALLTFFTRQYGIGVFPAYELGGALPAVPLAQLMGTIGEKCSFGDALVLHFAERYAPSGSIFVSWDAEHFVAKTTFGVVTPEEYLRGEAGG